MITIESGGIEKTDEHEESHGGSADAVYALGLFGAWAFYIGRAKNFREGLIGFFKGLFWPAFLVYDLLVFLEKK